LARTRRIRHGYALASAVFVVALAEVFAIITAAVFVVVFVVVFAIITVAVFAIITVAVFAIITVAVFAIITAAVFATNAVVNPVVSSFLRETVSACGFAPVQRWVVRGNSQKLQARHDGRIDVHMIMKNGCHKLDI
jgi:hypothetical protein